MRQPLPFDTHSYVKRLVAAGMPEAQAEVQAEALAEVVLSHLATKDDILQAKVELRRDFENVRVDLDRKIEALRAELKADSRESELRLVAKLESELRKQLIWFFGMLVVWSGVLAGLARLSLGRP